MATTNFIIYDSDGAIRRSGACPASMLSLQMALDEFMLEGEANDVTQYVDVVTHTVQNKAVMAPAFSKTTLLANGLDSIVISNLPVPCTVALDSTEYAVPDGIFEFTVDVVGTYTIKINSINALQYTTQVIAS